jgi:hypothetical protein
MSQEHPYLSSVPQNDQCKLRQGLFPAWHNRRHSDTSDKILNESERKSGSFDALINFVETQKLQQDSFEQAKPATTKAKDVSPVSASLHTTKITEGDVEETKKNVKRNRSVKFVDK